MGKGIILTNYPFPQHRRGSFDGKGWPIVNFGMLSREDPGNHVLDWGADAPTGRGAFREVYGP